MSGDAPIAFVMLCVAWFAFYVTLIDNWKYAGRVEKTMMTAGMTLFTAFLGLVLWVIIVGG